ncbi:MAG: hypothetical protein ABEH88_08925 [Halobacteriales archaeon]
MLAHPNLTTTDNLVALPLDESLAEAPSTGATQGYTGRQHE